MNKKIECHDCATEVILKDKHDELDVENIRYCPICGSENIEVIETKN